MNVVFSLILLAAALGCIVFLLTRRENARRSQYGPSGLSEFRTDLPLDDCFDRLDQHSPDDVFAYECRRENDGGFTLHLTLHQPTQQPLDTLYTLRFDPGRQTIVTLIFIREAFGYKEPLFQPAMLDEFMLRKFDAQVGTTVHRYILQKRLLIAKQLLAGGVPPNEVCQYCGFGDYANFYRAFRAEYNQTPRQYIQSARGK